MEHLEVTASSFPFFFFKVTMAVTSLPPGLPLGLRGA